MSIDPKVHQRLLELVYDLLPDEEAADLRARIESDPETARAYAEAEQTAGLLAEASRLHRARVELDLPEPTSGTGRTSSPSPVSSGGLTSGGAPRPKAPSRPGDLPALAPWAPWAVGGAAAALLLVALTGFFVHRHHLAAITSEHLRLIVHGPSVLQEGMDNVFVVTTTTVNGVPVEAEVELALLAPGEKRILKHKEDTDEDGQLRVVIPSDMDLPEFASLEVTARSAGNEEAVQTQLAVEQPTHATQLALDRPLYRPGDTVFYRSLTLDRFGMAADREVTVQYEILDPGGAAVSESRHEGETVRGVGCGQFVLAPGMAGGEYTLVARNPQGLFPEAMKTFFVRRYRNPRLKKELELARDSYSPGDKVVADFSAERAEGGPAAAARLAIAAVVDGNLVHQQQAQASPRGTFQVEFTLPEKIGRPDAILRIAVDDGGTLETIVKTIPVNLGKVDLEFYPEGGDLVVGLDNRVYFAARDPMGKPVDVRAEIYNSADQMIGVVETQHKGMGAFTFQPQRDQRYRAKIVKPAGVRGEIDLPIPTTSRKVVLTTGLSVFEPGEPLEFNVRAAKAGLPLVAAAYCRGVQVGRQWLTTAVGEDGEPGSNPVRIDLAPEAVGVLRLTLYDYSQSPPVPVAERLVYRRPERRLNVDVTGLSEQYAPGDSAAVSLVVTDEDGQPAAATLGVSVVDDTVLNLADEDAPRMPCHFLLATEVEKPEDLEDADFYLSNDPEAPAALDLLLGTQGWRRFVERTIDELKERDEDDERTERLLALGAASKPPLMFDNLGEINEKYKEAVAAFQGDRTHELNAMTIVSFFGGAALLLFATLLAVMNVATGLKVWIPAVTVSVICFGMGFLLTNPASLKPGIHGAVAFADYESRPVVLVDESEAMTEELEFLEEADPAEEMPMDMAELPCPVLDDPKAGEVEARERHREARGDALVEGQLKRDLERRKKLPGNEMFDADRVWVEPMPGMEPEMPLGEPPGEGLLRKRRFVVREYAHQHARPKDAPPRVRTDFAETLYWHPLLITDGDGRVQIRFDLSDSVTTFRVRADAHAPGGRLGAGEGELISKIPFSVEPKMPLEVTAGDRIDLPVAVANDTTRALSVDLSLIHDGLVRLDGPDQQRLELEAKKRSRRHFALDVVGQKGEGPLLVRGVAGSLADEVARTLRVVPPGFPISRSFSGELDGSQELTIDLPGEWVPGSLEVSVNVFPSMLADLQKGLDGILREPTGCFEQASTSNYPNVMSLQYMEENDLADPEVTRRAKELLDRGYGRLTGYECPKEGFEWFGADPGHEALTAYGLMQFRDMAEVYQVDPVLLDRTAEWLLQRRDGKGGFQRNPKALDSFGAAPQEVTDAYVTWALTESGQEGIDAEIEHAIALGEKAEEPYVVALAAAAAINAGKQDEGRKLLDKLAGYQDEDGRLAGAKTSITRSGGASLDVETTALAALAWLKAPQFAAQAGKAVEWITRSRQGSGGFGSTQATVLALKALVEHARVNKRTTNAGKLILQRDDVVLGEQSFEADRREAIAIDGLETELKAGENRLTITLTGENKLPYALDVSYRSSQPASDRDCAVRLTTGLAKDTVAAGETVALTAELANTTDEGQPMTVAILGLPAGLEPRTDQLKELQDAGTIDYFELNAREVICYWRSLAPKRKVELKLDLVAAIPGRYTGPASRAYLYYTAERKCWAAPLRVGVTRP